MADEINTNVKTSSNMGAPDDVGAADELMMMPLSAIASLDDADFDDPLDEEFMADEPPEAARQRLAQDFESLMGGDLDADGVAADLIDTGSDMILWGLTPSPDAVAIVPDLGDWTDPRAWLERIGELNLPADLAAAVERLARAAATQMEKDAEGQVRRRFAQRLGDLLRDGGVETLAVRGDEGFDWIVLNPTDLAREQDGEQWEPAGGFADSPDLRDLGVSLGQGGRVRLWPLPAPQPAGEAVPAPAREPPAAKSPPPPPPPARVA